MSSCFSTLCLKDHSFYLSFTGAFVINQGLYVCESISGVFCFINIFVFVPVTHYLNYCSLSSNFIFLSRISWLLYVLCISIYISELACQFLSVYGYICVFVHLCACVCAYTNTCWDFDLNCIESIDHFGG